MDQTWFEMRDVRRRRLDTSVWIPLRASYQREARGRSGFVGFKEEFFGAGTLAAPSDKKGAAEKLGWMDVGISHSHEPYIEDETYVPSDIYEDHEGEFTGTHLVLEQETSSLEVKEWHLHQDIVIALGLKKEGDLSAIPAEPPSPVIPGSDELAFRKH